MKIQFFSFCIILFIVTALSGCSKTYNAGKSQDILFQAEYLSNIGNSVHRGIIVDVKGNILTYNNPAKWHFPDDDQILGKNEVIENISSATMSDYKISPAELQKFLNHIDNIAASKVTLPKSHKSDSVTLSFYCYQYSESSLEYKRTIIKTEGNTNCENLNFYSKKIVNWLNELLNANLKQ
jgi:hypothetical protein